jgi:beta-N-acetylhexosaminidase
MTVPELAARLFMFPVTGTSLSAEDDAWLRSIKPGGVILVEGNFGGPGEIRSLVASIHATNPGLPPLVALDQEGGIVSRIADDPAPDAPAMGQLPRAEIATFARMRADSLAAYGFDVNFAPVADVASSPESIMSGRAFGDNPEVVAGDVAAYVEGAAGSGVLHCVKHFPGHGRVTLDSHEALPTLVTDEATWRETDALPFQAAVDVGVPMVMLGHLVAPMWDELPAPLSPAAITYLRDVMGFAGVIATDDLLMGALTNWDAYTIVDLALAAGVDLLLYVGLPDSPEALLGHVLSNVEQGMISVDRLMTSVRRLLHVSLDLA